MCPPSSAFKSAPSKATTGTTKGTRKPLADKTNLSPVAATKRPRRAAKDKANATSASNGYYSQDLDDLLESAGEAVKPDTPPKPHKPLVDTTNLPPVAAKKRPRRVAEDIANATSASDCYFSQDLGDLLDSDDQDIRPKTSRSRRDTSKKSNKKRDSEPAFNGSKNAIDVASAEDNDGDHAVQTATSHRRRTLRNIQKIPKKGVSTAPQEDGDLATEDYDVEPDDDSEFEDDFEPNDDFECLLDELFVSDGSDTEGDDELDDSCLSKSDSDTGGNAHGKRLSTSKSKDPEIKRQRLSPAQTVAEVFAKINEQIPVADDPDVVPESIFTTPAIT